MLAPKYLTAVREQVGAGDFYRRAHRRTFETIETLTAEGIEPDPITVADRLRADDDVEGLGGKTYILMLPTVAVAGRAPQHAAIVRKLAEERCGRNDLGAILDEVSGCVKRYVFLGLPEQLTAIALWIAHTHIVEQFETTPYLALLSPEKRSGKTRTLDVAELLVARPWRAVTPSEAVLYRKIEADRPTLLLDEVDAIFGLKAAAAYEGVRAILNAGFRRGTKVPRCVGEGKNMVVQDFDVYGAKAFAGIGRLPDTVGDRSIIIEMLRRAPDEQVQRFRYREAVAAAASTRAALERWSTDVDLSDVRPEIPEDLDDRAADAWEALLAIADSAGGQWPEDARRAARVLSAGRTEDTASSGIRLLLDCRRIFEESGEDRLSSERLVQALGAREESPWSDMTPRRLAAKLRHYKIAPTTLRIGDKTAKGYMKEDFADAWKRYLATPSSPETDSQSVTSVTSAGKPCKTGISTSVTNGRLDPPEHPNVTDANCNDLQGKSPDVTDVTDKSPFSGREQLVGKRGDVKEVTKL